MKKKGFTLVELLAVIVVLAIIALIAVPRILNVVEKARIGAAKSSALGYISSIEMKVATDSLEGIDYQNKEDYAYDEIKLNAKGEFPTGGVYSLYEGKVTNATFCINGYTVTYNNNKVNVGEKCNGEELKLKSSLVLSKSTVFLTYPQEEVVEVTENTSEGKITCTTSDSSVATCSISGNSITIKSGKKAGQSTLTIVSEGNGKYRDSQVAVLVSTEEGLLSVTANGYTGVYDGSSHGITVTSEGSTVMYGTEQGTYNLDKSPTYSETGEYTVYYEVTKEGYKPVRGSKTISITKAEGSVTAPTAKTLTYNGSAQELINAGSSTTGTIQYKLNNGSYSTSIPTATNAGTYTIYYKVVGDNNHNDVEEKSINVTIAKANNTLTLSSNTGSVTYPNSITFDITENISNGTLSCTSGYTNAVTCSVSGNTVTVTPGTKAAYGIKLRIKSAATTNYEEASATYVVTNNLGTLSVTANGYSGIYDGKAHGITVTSSGATIKYGTTSGTYNLTSSPTYSDAGEYTVYYQVTKEGYKTVTGSKTVVISQLLSQKVQLGDLIKMTPTKTSYTISPSLTGMSEYSGTDSTQTTIKTAGQTINPSHMKYWRVINVNADGTIEAVAEYIQSDTSGNDIYFYGATGYQKLVGTLNTIAAQYYNDKYTVSTHTAPYFREIGYNGQTANLSSTPTLANSGTTMTPPLTAGTLGQEYNGGYAGDTLDAKDLKLLGIAKGVTTADGKPDTTDEEKALIAYKLDTSGNATTTASSYWLASRIYIYNVTYTYYDWSGRCIIKNGGPGGLHLFSIVGANSSRPPSYAIRPIITLKSGIAVSSGDGQSLETAWNLQ